MTDGYKALREGVALLDLSGRGVIRATGEDRVRLLHAMASNHIEQLRTGQGCYAFFLNAQGRILADVAILRFEDHLLLDTEPETRDGVFQHLDKYIIADDVALEDITGQTAILAIEGPKAGKVLSAVGARAPDEDYSSTHWGSVLVVRASVTGGTGFRLFVPVGEREQVTTRLADAGAVPASSDDARVVRIENARPRYGEDITADHIPHETQMLRAVHFNKGCYLGQEIVERVRSRGHANRLLVQLVGGNTAPPAGTVLTAEGNQAGVVTSAVLSHALRHAVALGYLRTAQAREGQRVDAGGIELTVTGRPPN